TVVPSLRATTTCLARRTASCWETVDWSSPSAAWSSWTLRSRTRRTSRSRIRMGWARALKKSALKRWRSDAGTDPESNETLIYKYSHIVNEQSRVRPPPDLGSGRLTTSSPWCWSSAERGMVRPGSPGRDDDEDHRRDADAVRLERHPGHHLRPPHRHLRRQHPPRPRDHQHG